MAKQCHCALVPLGISLVPRSGYGLWQVSEEKKKPGWIWPLGLMATGLAGAAVMLFRGCWHGKMSWPVRAQAYSYQVCMGCGIKRLFDEQAFCAYGPYSYDLNCLIAWELSQRQQAQPEPHPSEQRSAS
jgi:hypothetical protein